MKAKSFPQSSRTRDLHHVAELMDTKYQGPFGWRFGWDGILGFVPGVGDLLTNGFSFYILVRAAMIGCPPVLLMRMGLNILIDNLFDAIPLIGNLFDFIWKANIKNLVLIENYLIHPRRTVMSSRFLVVFTLLIIGALMVAGVVLTFVILRFFFHFLQQQAW